MFASRLKTLILALSSVLVAIAIVTYPKVSVEASLRGLKLWWDVVFPSLLPFFIVAEIMIGFGVVSFIGVLLEPIMRPIFRVPGIGGFVFVMGLASGFPAGAKFTARLYEQKQLTKTEAERLASFTNFSNPLFMFGAVAYGFFHQASLGIIFALSHYIGNIGVGLVMRFYKGKEKTENNTHFSPYLFIEAFKTLHRERLKNKQPFGKMLGDAVHSSIMTLLMIGGFIILFSVLNQLLLQIHFSQTIAHFIALILGIFHLSMNLSQGIVPGLFEMTNGAKAVSQIQAPLIQQVIIVSFILGFSGFSIQAQVASILATVKLNFKPFFFGRILHGFISAFAALVLFRYLFRTKGTIKLIEVFNQNTEPITQTPITTWIHTGSLITLITLLGYILFRAYSILKETPR